MEAYFQHQVDLEPYVKVLPREEDIRAEVERHMHRHQEAIHRIGLGRMAKCDECGKIRRGRKWVKVKDKPLEEMSTFPAACPECYPRHCFPSM